MGPDPASRGTGNGIEGGGGVLWPGMGVWCRSSQPTDTAVLESRGGGGGQGFF